MIESIHKHTETTWTVVHLALLWSRKKKMMMTFLMMLYVYLQRVITL
jgi:hypothetical protein